MAENAYIDEFLKRMVDRKYSSRSIATFRYPLRKFFSFLAVSETPELPEVTPEVLEKYRLSLVRSNFTGESINTYIGTLKKFFAWLEDEGIIFSNPAENLKTPKVKQGIRDVPGPEEMERLLSVINITTHTGIRDRAMIETAYGCALRMNEMLKLTIFNPDFDNRTLRVFGKGKKERILPLGNQAVKWLKEYMIKARPRLAESTNCDFLWLTKQGRPMIEITYQKMLHHHAEKAELAGKVSGHTMRRACATHMLKNGAHPVAVQHLLGHADLTTLGRYLNLSLDDLRKAHAQSKVGK